MRLNQPFFPLVERVQNPLKRFPAADSVRQCVDGRHQLSLRQRRVILQRHMPFLPSSVGIQRRHQPIPADLEQPCLDIRRILQRVVFLVGLQKRLLDAVVHQIAVFPPVPHVVQARPFQLSRVLQVQRFDKRLFFFLHRAYAPFALLYGIAREPPKRYALLRFFIFLRFGMPKPRRSARPCRFPASRCPPAFCAR